MDGLNPAVVGGSGGAGVSSPSTSPKHTGTRALHPPSPAPASPAWLPGEPGQGPFPTKADFSGGPSGAGNQTPDAP